MNLLLTHAYFLQQDRHEQQLMRPYPPLGLLYISAYLKAHGTEVAVFDTTFSSRHEFRRHLQRTRPRIVGIYVNLMTRASALQTISDCREFGSIVVVGGPEPAGYADEYLTAGADVVVDGEGEITLRELVPHLLEHGVADLDAIDGIIYRPDTSNGADQRAPVRTAARAQISDLDTLPDPDREAIDIDRYVDVWRTHHGAGSVSLITARGCPYKCNWCSHSVFGFSHRRRSPVRVADELEHIVSRYRPDQVWYADDVFTINHRWLHEYGDELERRGLRVPFETISREDRLDTESIARLASMGCRRLWVGAESGSQRVLDAMQRQTDAPRVEQIVHELQQHGIEVGLFIMLGYEGERMSDIEETVAFLKRARPDRFVTTVAYPIRGTKYYQRVSDRLVVPQSWATSTDRDISVRGRHSDRFYRCATRWMVNEVERARLRSSDRPGYGRLARATVKAHVGRLGMHLLRHQQRTAAPQP